MARRATYSFAGPSPFAWFGDGHVFAGEGVTGGDGFAAFAWGDCLPARDPNHCTRSQPINSRRTQESSIMSVTADHRTSSTLAGARSISTRRSRPDSPRCSLTTTPTPVRPCCRPRRPRAN